MDWTKEQHQAITARSGSLLISAAAGSGKTAVLVERVIGLITDETKPVNIDELLVVTFTNAAATQMHERISAAIAKRIAENPMNRHLIRQQALIPYAKICTIDSFCSDLVRKNFNLLDINPQFATVSDHDLVIMQSEALRNILEKFYIESSPEFLFLTEMFNSDISDGSLEQMIIKINKYINAYPSPSFQLALLEQSFSVSADITKTIYFPILLCNFMSVLKLNICQLENVLTSCEAYPEVYSSYSPVLQSDIDYYNSCLDICMNSKASDIQTLLSESSFPKTKRKNLSSENKNSVSDNAEAMRKSCKSRYSGALSDLLSESEEEFRINTQYLAPFVKKLFELVNCYSEELSRIKSENNALDFNDILHNALKLLIDISSYPTVIKSDLSVELSQKYAEILVDECQDINEAQNMLFTALSKDGNNIFMVGDVKQSIYKFRLAMPEIFIRKRMELPAYDGSIHPSQIILDKNFRSRREITDFVNFTFSQLMSSDCGDIEYTADEALTAGADYPESDQCPVELHIIKNKSSVIECLTEQAIYISNIIKNLIKSGYKISESGTERPVRYSDICILLRSTKNRAAIYLKELTDNGVPCHAVIDEGFFKSDEVRFMIALLNIVDNPLQDIHLLTVLLSPFYGFTPDDLSKIRVESGSESIYHCLLNSAKNGDAKCDNFLKSINEFHKIASVSTIGELVKRLLLDTEFISIAGAMPEGEQKKNNLRLFGEFVTNYDISGSKNIFTFLRYVEKISDYPQSSMMSSNDNAVNIMTIHKSKGLEFPVCILANCENKFSKQDSRENVLFSSNAGLGIKIFDKETGEKKKGISFSALNISRHNQSVSEDLRVLYVAMTRAKEKLITVMTVKNIETELMSLAASIGNNIYIPSFSVVNASSYADWILMASLRHSECSVLRDIAGYFPGKTVKSESGIQIFIVEDVEENNFIGETVFQSKTATVNRRLLKEISDRLSYKYPFEILNSILSKRAASDSSSTSINQSYFAASRPAFIEDSKITAAQKGTLIHKFMQVCDFKNASEDFSLELQRLIELEFFTSQETQFIDMAKIDKFLKSDIMKRILESDCVYKEYKFAVNIPVSKLYEMTESFPDESVLIQGAVDLAFSENGNLVIIDYKTDRVSQAEELLDRYSNQLCLYKEAFEMTTDYNVSEVLLYSFELGKAINVNTNSFKKYKLNN